MHMATTTRRWTRADLERMPEDGNRYEVLDGALLVTPSPFVPHQFVASLLNARLQAYCESHRIGASFGPGAIPHGKSELIPDVLVALGVTRPLPKRWTEMPTPSLVVEVLSDSTRRRDLGIKRDAYELWGVPEYWIVDCEDRSITNVRAGQPDARVTDAIEWQPRPDIPALRIELDDLFGWTAEQTVESE